jgi:hypothetical protein
MEAGSARADVCRDGGRREMLVVVGVALAGLLLAALAAFAPWYAVDGDPAVIELRGPLSTVAQR